MASSNAVNSVGDFIRSVFPSIVNRKSEIFEALLCNEDEDGAIESVFAALEEERQEWQESKNDVYNQTGDQLEKTRRLFSAFERYAIDYDANILKRLKTLFYREGGTLWGTKWDIIRCVRYYLEIYKVYVVNNTADWTENLLQNGDFETNGGDTSGGELLPTGWEVSGDASYSDEADECFENTYGMAFSGETGRLSQSAELAANSLYFLHFFLYGKIRVAITDASGLYWNEESEAWQEAEHWQAFENADEFQSVSLRFWTADAGEYAVVFAGDEDGEKGCVDYVMLNLKTLAPTFSVIAVFDGESNLISTGASYAAGGDDAQEKAANPKWDYDNFSYLAPTDTSGITDYGQIGFYAGIAGSLTKQILLTEIMRVLKPAGVTCFVEILDKAKSE